MTTEEVESQIGDVTRLLTLLSEGADSTQVQSLVDILKSADKHVASSDKRPENERNLQTLAVRRAKELADLLGAEIRLAPWQWTKFGERVTPAIEAPSLTFSVGQLINAASLEASSKIINDKLAEGAGLPAPFLLSVVSSANKNAVPDAMRALGAVLLPPVGWSVYSTYPRNVADLLPDIDVTSSVFGVGRLAKQELDSIKEIRKRVEQIEEQVKTAGGNVGQSELTKGFTTARNVANLSAGVWTLGVLLLFLTGVRLPFWALSQEAPLLEGLSPVVTVIVKVLVGLPFFALAAYCGHVAAQHRETARHLTILVAQLKTVGAYTADMPDGDRDKLRLILGERAFSDPGLILHDKGKVTAVPEELTELLKKAIDALVASQKAGGSKP